MHASALLSLHRVSQALLSAGFIVYLGRCTEVDRLAALRRWSQVGPWDERLLPQPTASPFPPMTAAVSLPPQGIEDVLGTYAGKVKGFDPTILRSAAGRNFDFLHLLSTESEMLGWKAAGLPSDALSMENTVVVLAASAHSGLCPFLVDPATLATEWLHRFLESDKSSPVEVLSAQDARFQTQASVMKRRIRCTL
jgi:hypothetical protein